MDKNESLRIQMNNIRNTVIECYSNIAYLFNNSRMQTEQEQNTVFTREKEILNNTIRMITSIVS